MLPVDILDLLDVRVPSTWRGTQSFDVSLIEDTSPGFAGCVRPGGQAPSPRSHPRQAHGALAMDTGYAFEVRAFIKPDVSLS